MTKQTGIGTLEFGIVIVVFLILMTGLFDLVNIYRGTTAANQAATLAVQYMARLEKDRSSVEKMSEAVRLGEGELRAAFPRMKHSCNDSSEPLCGKVDLNLNGTEVNADVTFSLPMMLLPNSPKILSGHSEIKLEDKFSPDHRPKFHNSYVDPEE